MFETFFTKTLEKIALECFLCFRFLFAIKSSDVCFDYYAMCNCHLQISDSEYLWSLKVLKKSIK